MNPIDHLHEKVTPKVLKIIADRTGNESDKRKALSSLFSILGVRLSDSVTVEHIQNLSSEQLADGKQILDVIFRDEKGESQVENLDSELAKEFNLPQETVSALTTAATPLALDEFKILADTDTISGYLQDRVQDLIFHLPNWAEKLLPIGLLTGIIGLANSTISGLKEGTANLVGKVSDTTSNLSQSTLNIASKTGDAVSETISNITDAANTLKDNNKTSTATHVNDQITPINKEESSFLKSLLPIVGLVIFAGLAWLMLRGCQEKPAPVAKPVEKVAETAPASTAPVNATPATFSLATDEKGEAIYSCRGEAGSEGVFASIRTALSGVFGVADKCNLAVTSGVADSLPAGDHLEGIFKLMKGVPNSSVTVNDKTIRFNAGNPDDLAKLVEGAKGLVPADFVVEAEPQLDAAAAVANSIDTAKNALSGLTDTATADDLVRALNLQIINFATASSDIPAENKEILDLAAAKLAQLPDAKLKITGHTDSQGKYESNKALSDKRAKAVHDYLVSKGVSDERLEAFGASSDHPVATNATEQGRFQNRRIEFTLLKDGEQIAAVGNAPSSPATAEANAQANAEQPAEPTAETDKPAETAEPKAEETKPAESK